MTRAKLMALGMALALIAIFAAPAQAQDGPTITVDPASVDAPGDYDFTVTGEGWTAAPPIFIVPCEAPASGDIADLDSSTCDTGNLTPATPADGAFEVTVSYTVPEGGIVIAASDAAQSEAAGVVVSIGAADDGGDDAADDGEGEGEGEAEGDEDLAETGVESGALAIAGIAILAAGAMVVGTSRRND